MNALEGFAAAETSVEAGVAALCDQGFVLLRAAARRDVARVDDELDAAFDYTPFSQGPFYGDHTVRFGRLLARSEQAAALVLQPLVLQIVAQTLRRWHCDLSLSFTQAVAVHPGAAIQAPHRDGDMWPVPTTDAEHLVNVIWPLTRFTGSNGGTRLWPGSHRGGTGATGDPLIAEMAPGDALIFLGSTLHGAGANRSDEVRKALIFGYAAAWLLPSENPSLAYPPSIARHFPRPLTALLGYRRFAPNLNNVDCRCPSELLGSTGLGAGAIDELTHEQVSRLHRFNDEMRRVSA